MLWLQLNAAIRTHGEGDEAVIVGFFERGKVLTVTHESSSSEVSVVSAVLVMRRVGWSSIPQISHPSTGDAKSAARTCETRRSWYAGDVLENIYGWKYRMAGRHALNRRSAQSEVEGFLIFITEDTAVCNRGRCLVILR